MSIDDSNAAEAPQMDLRQASDGAWEAFQQARRDLAEVMTDDELRELGFNVDVLDAAP